MERHEEPVGDDLWKDIEVRLPEHQASKRVTPVWRRYTAAAAVALALIGGGSLVWHLDGDTTVEAPAITMTSPDASTPEPEVLAHNDVMSPDVDEPAASCIAQAVPSKHAAPPVNISSPNEPLALADKPTQAAPTQATTENEPPAKLPEEPAEQPVEKPTLGHINVTPNSHATRQSIIMPMSKKPSVSVEFYASNTIKPEGSSYNGDWVYLFTQLCDEPIYNILFDSIPATEYYHKFNKHHAPYSLGVSVRLPLNERLALTSGLVYTRLKSDFSSSDKEQILHYVGVPLGVTYTIWGYKRFNVYAIGGMQADFNVKASVKKHDLAHDANIGKDRVQFSALAGPGLQFDLSQALGIYVEPTARYNFNNGSDIENYFKEKPWNININAGLRLSLNRLEQ